MQLFEGRYYDDVKAVSQTEPAKSQWGGRGSRIPKTTVAPDETDASHSPQGHATHGKRQGVECVGSVWE